MRDEIAHGRPRHEDLPAETADLNDAWMTGEAFGPPGAEGDDRQR